jgi:hypothetical protein
MMTAARTSATAAGPERVAAEAIFAARRAEHDAEQLLDGISRSIIALLEQVDDLADVAPDRLRAMAASWRHGAHRWARRSRRLGPGGVRMRVNASLALLAAWEIEQLVDRRSHAPARD